MEYKVLAALREDLNEGWVWKTNSGLDSRSIVKITNLNNNKSIFCECLEIEENYIKAYNQTPREYIDIKTPTITINSWYRKKLGGIKTKSKHELGVVAYNCWCGKLKANLHHPQVVVRMATWLAIISVGLGIIGIALGLLSLYLANK